MKNYVQPGDVIAYTPTATVASGDLVPIGARVGVVTTDGVNGTPIEARIEGVVSVPKLAADNMTVGAVVYLDAANKRVTLSAGGNTVAGFVIAAAAAATTTALLKLNG